MAEKSGKIAAQEWEQLIQDFRSSSESRAKCLSQHAPRSILEQALQAASRKDFPLKLQILAFIDENAALLINNDDSAIDLLIDTLKSTLHSASPSEGGTTTSNTTFKEQMMVMVTSAMVTQNALTTSPRNLETLVEILLNFINRPNHSLERHLRATACECLRELEKEYPCLLHFDSGHLLSLCQSERTHAGQAYTLLLSTVLCNVSRYMREIRAFYTGAYSILFTTAPLVPFTIPSFLPIKNSSNSSYKDFSEETIKEFRRVISFLLEKPGLMTEPALSEFVSDLCQIAACLELQPSLLKLQFWGLLHSYNPITCHTLLNIFTRFPEAFEGEEVEIYKRLVLYTKEYAQHLTVQLLALHWLLGLENMVTSRGKEPILPLVKDGVYPEVFDPLSLKAAKLECLAKCATVLDKQVEEIDGASKLLNDGLVCLSSYKWLPQTSTETMLLFRTLHRFLISGLPHPAKRFPRLSTAERPQEDYVDSLLFRSLQETLVEMARASRKLVDRILALLDRFLNCETHHGLGERLLRTFSEDLIPTLSSKSLYLSAYFPLMERIAESSKIPPGALIVLLTEYIRHRVEKDSGEYPAKLWLRGSEVLTICRTLLMHHHSSRIFRKLTGLFGYLCRSFPDIEVRDSARFYLRMLTSVPGNKLRQILAYGDERTEESKPQLIHVSSFLASPSPRSFQGKKQPFLLSSFILLTRVTQLLVRTSWALVVHDSFQPILVDKPPEDNKSHEGEDTTKTSSDTMVDDVLKLTSEQQKIPRMMDAKTADILSALRMHFSQIPESGVKIQVVCRVRAKSQPEDSLEPIGIYAVVINFSTSGMYRPIPSVRVPYLQCEPARPKSSSSSPKTSEICQYEPEESEKYSKLINVVLEPIQPVPTLVDCHIVYTDEDTQTVQGQLENIPVGIEDLFMKPPVPEEYSSSEEEYLLKLFNALWFACSGPGKLGTEIFLLKGGFKGVGLRGSESVKLLEAQADRVVSAVETYLSNFVVSVSGRGLKAMMNDDGKIVKFFSKEERQLSIEEQNIPEIEEPLRLEYSPHESDNEASDDMEKDGELGCLLVLIFLPPRYHLLLRMEVSDWSTLIRIRTDYWPSLAHIDEFLESFVIHSASPL